MNEKDIIMDDTILQRVDAYVTGRFASYANTPEAIDVETELRHDLHEHYREARARGLDEEEAYDETIASIGDLSELLGAEKELPGASANPSWENPPTGSAPQGAADKGPGVFSLPKSFIKFWGAALPDADFQRVTMEGTRFDGSVLKRADFTGAQIARASMKGCVLNDAVFDGADLSGAVFSGSAMRGVSFRDATLVGAKIVAVSLKDVVFTGADLTRAQIAKCDAKGARLDARVFNGTTFNASDLTDACFDGTTLTGVVFHHSDLSRASFRQATLVGVSFGQMQPKNVRSLIFDGTAMDKITYNLLQAYGSVDLAGVTLIDADLR